MFRHRNRGRYVRTLSLGSRAAGFAAIACPDRAVMYGLGADLAALQSRSSVASQTTATAQPAAVAHQ